MGSDVSKPGITSPNPSISSPSFNAIMDAITKKKMSPIFISEGRRAKGAKGAKGATEAGEPVQKVNYSIFIEGQLISANNLAELETLYIKKSKEIKSQYRNAQTNQSQRVNNTQRARSSQNLNTRSGPPSFRERIAMQTRGAKRGATRVMKSLAPSSNSTARVGQKIKGQLQTTGRIGAAALGSLARGASAAAGMAARGARGIAGSASELWRTMKNPNRRKNYPAPGLPDTPALEPAEALKKMVNARTALKTASSDISEAERSKLEENLKTATDTYESVKYKKLTNNE
jgi:hypothetical protein